jgi:hypothetical protein
MARATLARARQHFQFAVYAPTLATLFLRRWRVGGRDETSLFFSLAFANFSAYDVRIDFFSDRSLDPNRHGGGSIVPVNSRFVA